MIVTSPTANLREVFDAEGYIYLPGLVTEEAERLRAQVLEVCHDESITSDPTSGRMATDMTGRPPRSFFEKSYPAFQRLEEFHRLGANPTLVGLIERLVGEPVFCHADKVLRVVIPTNEEAPYGTAPHQDFVKTVIISDVVTCWIALSPCSATQEGLRVLPRSHKQGVHSIDFSMGRSLRVYLPIETDDPRWVTADFMPGDVVLMHSLTVHAGGVNLTDTVRLSADIRFQSLASPLLAEHTKPHGWPTVPDWGELTAGWSTTAWCEVPESVELVEATSDEAFAAILAGAPLPPSRLVPAGPGGAFGTTLLDS